MVAFERQVRPSLDVGLLRALVKSTVDRKFGMFAAYRDLSKDDLFQDGLERALLVHPLYTPGKGKYSTFISCAVGRCFIDIIRKRSREVKRRDVFVRGARPKRGWDLAALAEIRDWFEAGESAGLPGGAGGDDETLAEWLAKVYRFACGVFPDRTPGRGGRNWFTPAQRVTIALLMRRKHLSTRGARELLLADAQSGEGELAAAIGLRHVPSHQSFHNFMRAAARFLTATA